MRRVACFGAAVAAVLAMTVGVTNAQVSQFRIGSDAGWQGPDASPTVHFASADKDEDAGWQ